MRFPELRNLFKRTDAGELLSLGLETKGLTFTAVSVGEADFYRKYPEIYSILAGGLPAWSGESVSIETALQHPVVWACYRIISESIGYIPAYVMQMAENGTVQRDAVDHPMYSAMLNEPNDEISAQGLRELLTGHCLMSGGGFAKIVRRSGTGTAIGLEHLLPDQTVPDREKTGQKRLVYVIKNELGATDKTYTVERGKPQDILHIRGLGWNGIRGFSVIEMGRNSIGTALAAERNIAQFWANGGRVPYLLKMAGRFKTDTEFQKFRTDWEATYSQPHKAPILENGTTYEKIGSTMEDAQANEFRQQEVAEITRWFDVSPPLIHDLSRATFSNVEELFRGFVKFTLSRWLGRWEQDFRRCVLTPEEKTKGFFLRHNIRELLRGDFKTRMDGYASALQNGHMSIDEVRDDNDMNPLPNGAGSFHHVQLNMGTLTQSGQVQPASLLRIDQPQSSEGAA